MKNNEICQVLIVDDEQSIRRLLKKELETERRDIHTSESAANARELCKVRRIDVVVLDIRLPDGDGMDLLIEFKKEIQDVEVVLITGHGDIDNAVEAMKIGAYDYITKPFSLDRLELVIEKAYQRVCLQRENRMLRDNQCVLPPQLLVGKSEAVKHIQFLINKVAPTNVPVLITGESGAGKDVVARSIHAAGSRRDKALVIKNCASLQKELSRSELFGHVRGAFTGAVQSGDGLMWSANEGTLFLDEIGELPIEVQASLLRVLESKTYRRVGDKEERQVDVRFLFATNRNLAVESAEGRFHEALFHRINVFNIKIPSLSERREDIPLLVDYFLNRLSNGGPACKVTPSAMQCLLDYDWPGNVRELRNVIERSIILSENGIISEQALPKEIVEKNGDDAVDDFLSLDTMEKKHIRRVLDFYSGNRSLASEALGIGRKTLYRKLLKYGLS